MKAAITTILFSLISLILPAQTPQTILLDQNELPGNQSNAVYYRHLTKIEGSMYRIEDYLLKDSTMYQKGVIRLVYGTENLETGKRDHMENPQNLDRSGRRNGFDGKFIKQGEFERYYPNGQIEWRGQYAENQKKGPFKHWYRNGVFKGEYHYSKVYEIDHQFRVMSFYDSTGHQMVTDGDGEYLIADSGTEARGRVKNGFLTGEWNGTFMDKKFRFRESYQNGKLRSGVSMDSLGKQYQYFKIWERPQYKKGDAGLYKFLGKNISYPKNARKAGIEGTVYVEFVVDKEGNTTLVKIIKGISPECNEEALRVVEKANNFIPGRVRGQKVQTRMVLPIYFKLR